MVFCCGLWRVPRFMYTEIWANCSIFLLFWRHKCNWIKSEWITSVLSDTDILTRLHCVGKNTQKNARIIIFLFGDTISFYYFWFTKPQPLLKSLEKCTRDTFSAAQKREFGWKRDKLRSLKDCMTGLFCLYDWNMSANTRFTSQPIWLRVVGKQENESKWQSESE